MRKITCSGCDEIIEPYRIYKYRYCLKCQAEHHRKYQKGRKQTRAGNTPEQRVKNKARDYANRCIKKGILKKQPCSSCGSEKAEKHHSDYSKPLDVTWLCRHCHSRLHNPPQPPFQHLLSSKESTYVKQFIVALVNGRQTTNI